MFVGTYAVGAFVVIEETGECLGMVSVGTVGKCVGLVSFVSVCFFTVLNTLFIFETADLES